MSCTDLSNNSRKQTPQHPSGLCTVCQGIGFVSLTSKACQASHDGHHFHIGKLRNVARKQFCPGCRLILSVARTMDSRLENLDKATITIQQRFFPFFQYVDDERKVRAVPHVESFTEVTLNGRVAGTIIRTEETGLADPPGLKSTISESKEPVSRGRVVLPEVNVSLIKQWIQSCNVQHGPCRLPTLEIARELNIHLIDVHDHRIIPATLAENYVALSYVWGPNMKPSLTRDTMSKLSSKGGLEDFLIPRTLMDAVYLVKCIGMQYLWVDSLCIVQDDDNDRQQQLTIMDSIFSGAKLLVVAATGSDANAGLPGIGSTPRRISQRIEKITGTQFITAQPSVQQAIEQSVWNSRGWTFQEAILSRRALVFTESLVYWCCQVDTCREDISSWSPDGGLILNEINSIWPHRFQAHRLGTCRTFFYCQLAEAFSQRSLKEKRDVVWAFIGILRLQTSHFLKGFIWGLPYEGLDATLLWSEFPGCVYTHSRQAYHTVNRISGRYNLTYPSWSWLSIDRPVSFRDRCGASTVSEVTWHEPLKFVDETSNTYLKSISLKDRGERHQENPSNDLLAGSKSEREVMDYGFLHFTAQTAVLTLKKRSDNLGTRTKEALRGVMRAPILVSISLKRTFRTMLALAMQCLFGRARVNGDKADRNRGKISGDHWVIVTIHSPQGKQIGMLPVPSQFLNGKSERAGEFVLLSSNADKQSNGECKEITKGADHGGFEHVKGCKHIRSRNIMLIEWDRNVAYRRSLGEVDKESWEDIKTEVKTIVLG